MRIRLVMLQMLVPAALFAQSPAPVEQRAPPANADKDKAASTSWGDSAKHGKDADSVKGAGGNTAAKSTKKKSPPTAGTGAAPTK